MMQGVLCGGFKKNVIPHCGIFDKASMPDNTSCLHQCNPINELSFESDKCFPTALWCYINIPR